jgi:acetyl-CoA carboxylase biotin carboxylase subunit
VPATLSPAGHAIEARILAEDGDFRPSPGRISRWQPPEGARMDSAVAAGSMVPPWYDSLVAKLVVHGADRAAAVDRLAAALGDFRVEGVATSIPFLRAVARHPDFTGNRLSTRWLERVMLAERAAA